MKNNIENYFSETDFDFQEPENGHFERFENKLKASKKSDKISWKWLSVAASILLMIGFWFGKIHQKTTIDLADISPKMEEVQGYFVAAIHQKTKIIEKIAFAVETTVRYTFTDELDFTTSRFSQLNFGGTSNDWYMFSGISLVYTFGRPACFTD